jgi:hypothetical protein
MPEYLVCFPVTAKDKDDAMRTILSVLEYPETIVRAIKVRQSYIFEWPRAKK